MFSRGGLYGPEQGQRLGPCRRRAACDLRRRLATERAETADLGHPPGTLACLRDRLQHAGGGTERYPLDVAPGLEAGTRHNLGVQEGALWAATEVSDEKTERLVAKFAGLEMSRGTIHRIAQEAGKRLLAQDAT